MDRTLTFASNRLFDTYRTVEAGGKEWLVVNGVPLVEGVLNGRFVSADEFGSFVSDWNDIPVVFPHPKQNGGSARVPNPDVPVVGRFYNAKMDGKRLIGEYWLDKALITNLGDDGRRLLDYIEKQKPVETSTGYWSETTPASGQFNGRQYGYVDQNIHPDHIALLTQEAGACSLSDGCGLNRNSAGCQTCDLSTKKNAAPGSYEGKMQEVYEAFNKKFDPAPMGTASVGELWVSETYPDHIICRVAGDWYWVGYSRQDGEFVFDDRAGWKKAIRIEDYVIVQNVTGSLPAEGKAVWEDVYQKSKEKYGEERAAQIAWGAVKRAGWKQDKDGKWHKKSTKQNQQDLEGLAVALLFAQSIDS